MIVQPIKTRIFRENENLEAFIREHIPVLKEKSVLVVTSKIVALAEGRTRIIENEHTRERVIREESDRVVRTKYTWLTLKDGMVYASAGVDESNADGKLILLPKDSYKSAKALWKKLRDLYNIKELAIIVTDSRVLPLRSGALGIALGYAGCRGIRDYRKSPDLFGRSFKYSSANIADALAASAVLCMGEGNESCPLAVIEEAPLVFTDRISKTELSISAEDDLYLPFLNEFPGLRKAAKKRK